MACVYSVNGQENKTVTTVLQHIELTEPLRGISEFSEMLATTGMGDSVSISDDQKSILISKYRPSFDEDIDYINRAYKKMFKANNNLLTYNPDQSSKDVTAFSYDPNFATIAVGEDLVDQLELNEDKERQTKAEDATKSNKTPHERALDILLQDRGWSVNSEDEGTYIRTNADGTVETVPRMSALKNEEAGEMSERSKRATKRGNIIDNMFRQAITVFNASGRIVSINELKEMYANDAERAETDEFTDEFIRDIQVIISDILKDIKSRDLTIVSNIPTLEGTFLGQKYAGTIDFLAYDKDGNFYVYDLKTSTYSRKASYSKNRYNTQLKDAIQLTAYSEAIYQLTGIRPKIPAIYAVQTITDAEGKYVSAALETTTSKKGVTYLTLFNNKLTDARIELQLEALTEKQQEKMDKRAEREERQEYKESLKEYERYKIIRGQIINALEEQITALKRIPDSKKTSRDINALQTLQRELKRTKEIDEDIYTFHDFIIYVDKLANDAMEMFDDIEDTNIDSLTDNEIFETLNKINRIKESLDRFYSDTQSKSTINNLQTYLEALDTKNNSNTLKLLTGAIADMKRANDDYLDIALPLQAKLLARSMNLEVNEELDKAIKAIDETNSLQGFKYGDPRKKKFQEEYGKWEGLKALNKVQLEEKKLSEASILQELREVHTDPSSYSMWSDPLIYSSQTALTQFVIRFKEEVLEAKDNSDAKIMAIAEKIQPFLQKQGLIDNTSKIYEFLYEIINVRKYTGRNEYEDIKVLAFVQEVDQNKFYADKQEMIEKYKEEFEYPDDVTELDDYFESELGKEYLIATAMWHAENTVAVENAVQMRNELQTEIAEITRELNETSYESYSRRQQLFIELSAAQRELKKIWRNNQFVGKATKPDPEKYRNEKYDAMTEEQREIYNLLLDAYKAEQKQNGTAWQTKNSWDDFTYVLPSVRVETIDALASRGVKTASSELYGNTFKPQITDTEYVMSLNEEGEKVKSIPIYYSDVVDEKLISRDVVDSIFRFIDMSERYRAKAKMAGMVNTMHYAVAERKLKIMSPDGNFFQKAVSKRTGYEEDETVSGKYTNAYQALKSFIDVNFYGAQKKIDMKDIEGSIKAHKRAALATGVTAALGLSLNALQAFNQLALDTLIGNQEAWTREVISPKNAAWASKIMYLRRDSIGAVFDKAKNKLRSDRKLAQFVMWANLDQSLKYTGGKTRSGFRNVLKTDTLFVLQSIPDGLTSLKKALAIADSYRGKLKDSSGEVILNKHGKPANLWDVLVESNGVLTVDPRVANFKKIDFINKLTGMIRKANQLKGGMDTPMIDTTTWGPIFTLYRRYIQPGVRKAFGKVKGAVVDPEFGTLVEGYYGTIGDILLTTLMGGNFKYLIQPKKWSKFQQANAVRIGYIAAVQAIIGFTVSALAKMIKDEDDEDKLYWMNFALYQLLRLRMETLAFANPVEAARLLASPTATINPVLKGFNLIKYSTLAIVGSEEAYYKRDYGRFEEGDLKAAKYFQDLIPLYNNLLKAQTPEEAAKWFQLGGK